ncbi:MAG: SCP2 sterol-binding domain-containing protein [Candidatus Helarchaeota archaeon]
MSEKLKLGSIEWAKEFANRCNTNEDFLEYAEGLNTSFNLNAPDAGISFHWRSNNGRAEDLDEGLNEDAEFTLEGTKDVWIRVIKGELNFMDAVQKKLIIVKGPLPKLMKYLPATTEMIKIIESMSDITDFNI